MTDKTDAWMPLWIGAYLADTQHLARDEHGAYLLLLMAYWRAGGPLPDEDRRLAAIAKATPKEWKGLRDVLAAFFQVADGVWTHKRVERELAESKARKTKASSKASAAAQARWEKGREHPTSNAPSNAPSTPQALHEQCPTPSPIPSSLRSEGAAKRRAPPIPRPDDVDQQTWTDWCSLRAAKKATVSATVVAEARTEAGKAGITLERFLAVWCIRGSQGLQAEWLKPHEIRPSTETNFQRADRERAAAFAPGVAARGNATIDEVPNVTSIAGY